MQSDRRRLVVKRLYLLSLLPLSSRSSLLTVTSSHNGTKAEGEGEKLKRVSDEGCRRRQGGRVEREMANELKLSDRGSGATSSSHELRGSRKRSSTTYATSRDRGVLDQKSLAARQRVRYLILDDES
jgi:hypothetical protein